MVSSLRSRQNTCLESKSCKWIILFTCEHFATGRVASLPYLQYRGSCHPHSPEWLSQTFPLLLPKISRYWKISIQHRSKGRHSHLNTWSCFNSYRVNPASYPTTLFHDYQWDLWFQHTMLIINNIIPQRVRAYQRCNIPKKDQIQQENMKSWSSLFSFFR